MDAEEEALYVACVVRLAVDIDILQICLREVLGISICELIFWCLSHMRYVFGALGSKEEHVGRI
jgi:hypothetical protein